MNVRDRFTSTTLFFMSALLIWMADFVIVYVFAAIAVARQFADVQIAGVSIVPLVATISTALAMLATAIIVLKARTRLRAQSTSDTQRFIDFVVLGLGVLTLLTLIWIAAPTWL